MWQFRFANAAVKSHAVMLLGWLLKIADSSELAERQANMWSAIHGRVQERCHADFLRSIGYLTRRLLDDQKPDDARPGVEYLRQRAAAWLSTAGHVGSGSEVSSPALESQPTVAPDRSIIRALVTALGYLGDWEPILMQLGPGEPWLHEAARNVFEHWVPGPLVENPDGERQRAAEWIAQRLRRADLPAEVRSTLNQIEADLEQELGHHIWLDEH